MSHHRLRYLPLVLLLLLMGVFFFTGFYKNLSFETLKNSQASLKAFAEQHTLLTPLLFMGIYTFSVYLVIPDALFLCLVAGFLFSKVLAVLYVCVAETLGATLFFLTFYYTLGENLDHSHSLLWKKIEKKIQKNAGSYLLFLRLSHLLPYSLTNFAAACFKVRPWTFIWTCLIGFFPLALVFVQAGSELEKVFKQEKVFSFETFFNLKMKLLLILLGLLALLPLVAKKLWKHHD